MTQTAGTKVYTKPEILEEFGIKSNAYHDRLNFLGIKPNKNKKGSFLTTEQFELMKALDLHIQETGKKSGFNIANNEQESDGKSGEKRNGIVKSEDNNLEKLEPETQNFNPDLQQLMRAAAELKASDLAMPGLVTRAIANEMSEEDLPPDLKEKVNLAREIARPKSNPAEVNSIAKNLLSQYRSQGGS